MTSVKNLVNQVLISQKKVPAITVASEKGKTKARASKKPPSAICNLTEADRRQLIADNAYFRAQCRNFSPDGQEADWLTAEAEINGMLA